MPFVIGTMTGWLAFSSPTATQLVAVQQAMGPMASVLAIVCTVGAALAMPDPMNVRGVSANAPRVKATNPLASSGPK
jgi:hypothetical protein